MLRNERKAVEKLERNRRGLSRAKTLLTVQLRYDDDDDYSTSSRDFSKFYMAERAHSHQEVTGLYSSQTRRGSYTCSSSRCRDKYHSNPHVFTSSTLASPDCVEYNVLMEEMMLMARTIDTRSINKNKDISTQKRRLLEGTFQSDIHEDCKSL